MPSDHPRKESDRWRVPPVHGIDLASVDTRSTEGAPGDEEATDKKVVSLRASIREHQERLWAEQEQSLLVVLQAIDGGGKDGTIAHVFDAVNPQGCKVTGFKAPSEDELRHDFLWRVHKATPGKGEIAIFNRSHYEDVLVVRVHDLVPKKVWRARYDLINEFERNLTAAGTRIVKLFLHISKKEQAERFQARLDNPDKRWKFRRADLDERARWDDYQAAFEEAITRTSTPDAPWYVIPADRKWYRNWAVSSILVETLADMDPQFPEPEEDLTGIVVE
jgi:PPK2 family polyphosphate:nucleotide phosphotransferase